jgi:alginate O-acetyltransferase complex protein AlgI
MLFNSFEFLFFFGSVLLAYRALPPPFRRTLLLAASYVFYMAWEAWYGFLLFGVTLTSWLAALAMERCPGRARAALWAGIAGHLGVMFAFKYYGFFVENTARLLGSLRMGWNAPLLEVLLPVGISFYVFQSMGYMIDVYRRQVAAERSLAARSIGPAIS